jgi:RNA polymerase sigma-70 factor (ECF subfamily)
MVSESDALTAARAGDRPAFEALIEPYRRELKAHCYRMSGSIHDAEDLLQESLLKAWRAIGGFEGRSSLRTWLYKVTTSACLDAVGPRKNRALPMDFGGPSEPGAPMTPKAEALWIEPCPDDLMLDSARSPEARYSARESVALAFLAALQLLPAKQRAVLILRDVLGWQALECADLLQLTVAAVNSSLQRARETLSRSDRARKERCQPEDDSTRSLLARYLRVWEEADLKGLVALLHEDAVLSMPPFDAWFKGTSAISAAIGAMVFTPGSAGRLRLIPIRASGQPAFAMYEQDPATKGFRAKGLHVVELVNGRVVEITAFPEPKLFSAFGLPPTLA